MENEFYIVESDDIADDETKFFSGHEVFDHYFINHSKYDNAAMHYVLESKSNKLIAYFSLMASSVFIKTGKQLSAIEIKMFSINKEFQGRGLSQKVLDAIVLLTQYYSDNFVGADIILLHSVPVEYVVKMYEDCGFDRVTSDFDVHVSSFNENCVPMIKLMH